ncbi:MAG: tetratricopeptide repeat protein [Candidatus Krumholzibacteriota bacterium]|nr:tetratricopeptide repeat protein [Candidatus Krumholzibacteriota bacterium]
MRNRMTRKEIREDAFVSFFVKAHEYIKTHQNYLFAAVIVVIIIVSGIVWYSNHAEESKIQSINRFSEGLTLYRQGETTSAEDIFRSVKNAYGNSKYGVFARYFAGKCALAEGRNTDATDYFNDYLNNCNEYSFYKEPSKIAIAIAYENERDFEKAAEMYVELSEKESSTGKDGSFLEKASELYKLAGKKGKAVELLEQAREFKEGLAKREIQLKIDILKG